MSTDHDRYLAYLPLKLYMLYDIDTGYGMGASRLCLVLFRLCEVVQCKWVITLGQPGRNVFVTVSGYTMATLLY